MRPGPIYGYAVEHSIEDPFTGEITVRVRLGDREPRTPTVRRIEGVRFDGFPMLGDPEDDLSS
jgi:hypothetical protein